ncbi:MAG TPA: hypothetical protein VFZ78_08355 [Flavisolibacter sp.]
MDQNRGLFSLSIEPLTKSYLVDIARWARFLSLFGMVGITLMLVSGIAYSIWLNTFFTSMQDRGISSAFGNAVGIGAAVSVVVAAALVFFPLMYMYRFATRMRKALAANDQHSLNIAFLNLKIYFRYIGIITILIIVFFAMWLVLFGIGTVM